MNGSRWTLRLHCEERTLRAACGLALLLAACGGAAVQSVDKTPVAPGPADGASSASGRTPMKPKGSTPPPALASLTVTFTGLRSTRGTVRCALYDNADGFPRDTSKVRVHTNAAATDPVCRFTALPPGSYAVAVLHDEDDDAKMAYSAIGLPKEGFAFSRNAAPSLFGPPSFAACAIQLRGGSVEDTVKMRYL